ncbi:MAG: DUF4837 family protein [Flavobacteriaceae bacterium]|nr:DUF4837 family protein [Bacteroidia bacterium]NNL16803.1 DUF4837 family protein [Flavobacteriaceae bacterium]
MKKLIILAITATMVFACNNDKSKGKQKSLSESSGKLNNLTIVASNDLWKGNVGETIREVLAAPVDGLPQDEPLFTMKQMPPEVFSGFAAKNRTVLKIEQGQKEFTVEDDVYAKPQKVLIISGNTDEEIISQLKDNAKKIISEFKKTELTEKQRRIKKSLHEVTTIENNLGVSLNFPTVYRIAKEEDKFFWIRKDITTGSMNLMIYEVPLDAITEGEDAVNQVIKIRDSIGKKHIPGEKEGSYLITEQAYAPFFFKEIVDNKTTFVTKGTWEVKGVIMGGPFINYAIEDKINNRYLIAEGFTFAPSVQKRDFMFELEAIIKSLHIK